MCRRLSLEVQGQRCQSGGAVIPAALSGISVVWKTQLRSIGIAVGDLKLTNYHPRCSHLMNYKKHVDYATKFIPTRVTVAVALGLGTMIGWKRIVITVGEKNGKDHLSYGQGAAAEITAMATIGAADYFGLPVSTTHVLSSGVAGTMMANKTGLQWATVRNLVMALGADLTYSDCLVGHALLGLPTHRIGLRIPARRGSRALPGRQPCPMHYAPLPTHARQLSIRPEGLHRVG